GFGAHSWADLQRVGGRDRAGVEPEGNWRGFAVVALPAAVVIDVFHGQWPRLAVLYRAVFAAWLRQLHAWACRATVLAGHLERAGVSGLSCGAPFRQAA